jgi:hypothetical protein
VYLRIPVTASLTISGTATKTLVIRQILNLGTVSWDAGNVISQNGAVFDNQPSANLFIDAPGATWTAQGTGTNTILNRARGNIFVVTPGTTNISGMTVSNLGTLELASGATWKQSGGAFTNGSGSDLQGVGTLDVAGVTPTSIVNTGNVRPGIAGSVGILTIVAPTTGGGWPQGTGSTLFIDITGPLLGTEHDQLNVVGQLTSGGQLNLVGNITYQPRTISLPIVLFNSRVGQTFSITLFNNLPVPILLDYKTSSLSIVW